MEKVKEEVDRRRSGAARTGGKEGIRKAEELQEEERSLGILFATIMSRMAEYSQDGQENLRISRIPIAYARVSCEYLK
jgi:hypothetical protein